MNFGLDASYSRVPADELGKAVEFGLLSQEEARTVYFLQYPVLKEKNALEVPTIEKGQ